MEAAREGEIESTGSTQGGEGNKAWKALMKEGLRVKGSKMNMIITGKEESREKEMTTRKH